MNISHFCFILFNLKIFGEIVTTGTFRKCRYCKIAILKHTGTKNASTENANIGTKNAGMVNCDIYKKMPVPRYQKILGLEILILNMLVAY